MKGLYHFVNIKSEGITYMVLHFAKNPWYMVQTFVFLLTRLVTCIELQKIVEDVKSSIFSFGPSLFEDLDMLVKDLMAGS